MEYTYHYLSPLGGITLASDGEALTGLWFDGQKHFAETLSPDHAEKKLPVFALAETWLDSYFGGHCPDFTPPMHLKASAFRVTVWEILLRIPYGETASYGEIASRVTTKMGCCVQSARAVGGAVGRNPISLIIPCHRVVGANGSLTGYAGGLERKQRLLELERAELSGICLPNQRGGKI